MTNSIPKRQHWIPQFYLSYFAAKKTKSGESQAWVFSKQDDGLDATLVGIKNICCERYLYSPANTGEARSGAMESLLSSLESMMATIWPSIASEFVDFGDLDIRRSLALFMATTCLRHPRNIDTMQMLHGCLVDAFKNAPLRSDGAPDVEEIEVDGERVPFDADGWDGFRDKTGLDFQKDFVANIRRQAVYVAELLMDKRWSVILADSPAFITADSCVVTHHRTREKFGLGTPGTIVTFPLSPTRVLLLDDQFREPGNQYYPLVPEGPGAINYTIFHGAHDLMISPRSLNEVLTEIVTAASAIQSAGRAIADSSL
jgi:hypothetical protein